MTAVSTAWSKDFSSMPAMKKQALSSASGRSVLVRMQIAGNGWPTLVKKELSSGSVPLSVTAARVATVQNRHVVLFGHLVDGGKETVEVLLGGRVRNKPCSRR